MIAETPFPVSIALVHYPVLNKRGEVIGSAVTNLDVHDIARAARTYGVHRYYITTPYGDQRDFVGDIMSHWREGYGATYNPARKEALEIVRVVDGLQEAIDELTAAYGRRPLVVGTSAQAQDRIIAFADLGQMMAAGRPLLLIFGTAHGLAPEIMATTDAVLPPLKGRTAYNHLSVRSAVAIILDRLLGQ
ncbi:RNA methyltransferase [Desulfoprunum benzoelyticum]|jgi:hypothetical protein|uniref:tRNA (guanine-N(1)-)-methyltransferase C-terminal domain-containing protein n=1 Tax=Desulfoprunum benzoelyticum TaxID=1506996 RepID=A0A840UTB9_9BACT|nr:RNA methyltransferase [Desulfoprunum benzoelyticum]MBB5348915.1 hypothetical protein [Desulfoprunum benzoelyticum]MBM9530151.1 RNA methyltransferase [Desulfoprunum benzoelyticum]